jgi:hypothetical protein
MELKYNTIVEKEKNVSFKEGMRTGLKHCEVASIMMGQ